MSVTQGAVEDALDLAKRPSLMMSKEGRSTHVTANVGQISALSDVDMKLEAPYKPGNTTQDVLVAVDKLHVKQSRGDLRFATDTSWAAYQVYIAIVFSEALLFGLCSSRLSSAWTITYSIQVYHCPLGSSKTITPIKHRSQITNWPPG